MGSGFVVHIIESPSDRNLLDQVYEGGALQESLRMMQVSSERYLVVNEVMLGEAVEMIAAHHEKGSKYAEHAPILHLSCHGNEACIGLTSGERVDWTRLGEMIRPINGAAGNAMLVGVSACKGYAALNMARTLEAPPYGILVGPTQNVEWRDSMVAFITLYHRFTKQVPSTIPEFDAQLDAMNAAAGTERRAFDAAVASIIHKNYRQSVIDALRSPERQARMHAAREVLVRRLREAATAPRG